VIAEAPHRSGGHKESHVQGWLISVLLHSTVALTVILAVKQIQLTPQDDAFKWNVAMVSPAQQIQPTASSSTQAPARSAPSTTSTSSPPLRRGTPTQTLTQQAAASPSQLTTPSPSAAHTVQPAELIRHEVIAPIATETAPALKTDDSSTAISSLTDAVMEPTSAQAAPPVQAAQSEPASAQTQVAAISPAPSNVPAKRDYGWLSEAILRRMEELKRYPASARVDRAEGKVVVKAVIDEDGSISEVGVLLSSGHIALDEAAVETMRQAAPFHLPHPLGQPRMTIKIPMNYRLDR
jgi:periplasmic protein TonB